MKHLHTSSIVRRVLFGFAALTVLTLSACRQDMHDQPKFKPLRINTFYADQRASRPLVEGTVARGQLEDDSYFYTGMMNGKEGDVLPFPATEEVLQRGRERFNIYCTPCHSRMGDGNGMIVQRGFKKPPSYFEPRLMKAPIGHFFNVMTNGWGSMSEYASQVPAADRWKIAAYIRVLQLSQNATASDVPQGVAIANQPPDLNVNPERPMSNPKGTHGEAQKTETRPR